IAPATAENANPTKPETTAPANMPALTMKYENGSSRLTSFLPYGSRNPMRIAAALHLSGGVPNRGGVSVLGLGRQRSGLRRLSRRADGINRPLRPPRRFGPSDRENVF